MNKTGLNIQLVVIDPQNDFMNIPGAALPVPGANEDMKRVAKIVERCGRKFSDIHVTLDSHRLVDIAHPVWWVDGRGKNPAPFTLITASDIEKGIWTTRNPAFRKRSLEYTKKLEATGKYTLCIWPVHCLIGTWGHNVQSDLNGALQAWSEKEFAMVDYVTKGSNPWTEHYGALQAEVPDPTDPGTALNTEVLSMLKPADVIALSGEALSHCAMATINQIADNIGDEHIKKFHILTDCSSPVIHPAVDFPAISAKWLKAMEKRGMHLTTSRDFLA
ncbi:hypothetical protein HY413_01990 [Candidatus Kaiserbacteria bacterium]|nr:hypothetical protein [Candidatus Kaiserbacteria bacterium]